MSLEICFTFVGKEIIHFFCFQVCANTQKVVSTAESVTIFQLSISVI